ncbi:13172_t:CDS:1 [Racocetra fulgida]|uniref:13172_t:CDS:1 n=1 Tax=Racocetra fulgida TaxID=60492 RepID=A0A9N9FP36_9GLOM|nr:13172_t:CDS:1 [Racocetra fulgida]
MEVDDESNCFRVIDYEENIEEEAQDLKYKYKLPIRILAFFLFMNFSNGYYTWKQSLVGYVKKKQKYFTSKSSAFKIECRKIQYIKKDQQDPIPLHNVTLNIVEDEIKINQEDRLVDLETLKIEGDDEIDLYRKGRIRYDKWEDNWDNWDYWEARLSVKDNKIKLIQQLRFESKKATDFKSINGSVKVSIKVSDDAKDSNVDGSDIKIQIDKVKENDEDDEIADKDISILIENKNKFKIKKAKHNENINLDGDWKLKIKNGEVYLVNKRELKCKALNNKGKNIIHLYRVNLNGSWFKDSNNEHKYKQKDDHYKTIELDKEINELKKKLKLDGSTKLNIKDGKIYLEYEVNAEEGNSNDLKIKDDPFKYAPKSTDYWFAILKKENHDKFFLQYEVPPYENFIRLSVEGNKLINLKYYDYIKRFTNNEDIIKFTYDKMVYEEDLTESFKPLTINNECEVRRDKCNFIIRFKNDTLYGKFKSLFCHNDELTVSNGNNKIKFVRQHSFLKHRQHNNFAIEQDDKTGTIIIRIQVYAHSIVKITNKKDDDTKEKDDPMVTRLDHGGELKIQINRNTNDQNFGKNGVKIVLSRNINLHNRGLLKIKKGCVTFVEKPENKSFIDLTKHGFLNYVIYHHKKRVEKLRIRKRRYDTIQQLDEQTSDKKIKPNLSNNNNN